MAIPEMQRFKEKFPVYRDIDDATLLTKIVQKFPVYRDIAEREFGTIEEAPPTISSRVEGLSRIVKDRAGKAITLGIEAGAQAIETTKEVAKKVPALGGFSIEQVEGLQATAEQTTERLFGGLKAAVGGRNPLEGIKDPKSQPEFGESIVTAFDLKTPGQAVVAGTVGTLLDLGVMWLTFQAVPKGVRSIRGRVTKIKGVEVDAFKRMMKREMTEAGVQNNVARSLIDDFVAKKFVDKEASIRTLRSTNDFLRKNPGKISERLKVAADNTRAQAEAQGGVKKFQTLIERVEEIVKPRRVTPQVRSTIEPSLKAEPITKVDVVLTEEKARLTDINKAIKSAEGLAGNKVLSSTQFTALTGMTGAGGTKADIIKNLKTRKTRAVNRIAKVEPSIEPKKIPSFFTKTKSKKKLLAESETYKKFILGKIHVSRNLRDLVIGVTGDRIAGFDYKVKDLDTGEIRTHSTFISPSRVVEVSLEEVSSKVEPVVKVTKKPTKEKKQIPPVKVEAISNVTPPKVDLTNEVIDEIPEVNVQKTEAPVKPTKEVTSNEGTEIIQIDIRTSKGIQRTYMNPSDVVRLEAEISRSKITKVPALFKGIPVDAIIEKVRMKIGDEGGYIRIPSVEQAAKVVSQIKNFGNNLGGIVDPVRNAPAAVARAIGGTATAKNVLKFNIIRAQDLLNQMIDGSNEQAELITKFIESGGIEPFANEMTGEMRVVAEIVNGAINNMGKLAKKHKVIKTVLRNYLPHLVKDPNLTPEEVDAGIRQAISTKRISKYVASKLPRIRTEDGEIIFPTIEALELAGYEVINKNAIDLYTFVMLSEGVAVINAELVQELMQIPYTPSPTTNKLLSKFAGDQPLPKGFKKMDRPLMQVMTLKEGEAPPLGFKPMSRGVFAGKWVSPEAAPALSAISEPSLLSGNVGGRAVLKFINTTKRIRFLLPFFHTWNLYRNAIQARGLVQGTVTIFRGAKALKDPERVSEVIKMGVELHKLNKLSGGVVDKAYGEVGKFDVFGKMSEVLFLGLGDSISMGLAEYYKGVLKDNPKFNDIELAELVADTVNSLSGNIPEHEMNRFTRDVGRIALLARNWTLSNLRQVSGALGVNPKHWSKEQKAWATKNWAFSIARMFIYLFTINNIINYNASKKAYGTGRFTWENPKGRKIDPLIAVNKITGKEYYASNTFGTVGDMIHWVTRPAQTLTNKLNPSLKGGVQQIFNRDFFTGDKIFLESDKFTTQITKRLAKFVDDHLPAGTQPSKSKVPLPKKLQLIRLLGVAIGSENQNADVLQKMFDFREQKNYKMDLLDKKIMRKMATGDTAGAIEIGVESQRYSSVEGYKGLVLKMRNMTIHAFKSMSGKDKADFIKSLKPKEKADFFRALREGDVRKKILQ